MNPELADWFEREVLPHERSLARYLTRVWPHASEIPDLLQEIYVRIYEAAESSRLVDKGIAAMRREVQTWWSQGITEEELAARKESMIGSHAISLSTTAGLGNAILVNAQRGLPLSWLDDYPKAVEALTLAEVNGVIRANIDPSRMVLVKAGTIPAPVAQSQGPTGADSDERIADVEE